MDEKRALRNKSTAEPPENAAAEAFARLTDQVAGMEDRLAGRMAMMTRALEHIAIEKQSIEVPDYGPTLVRMNGHLAETAKHMKAIEDAPALQLTPEAMAVRIGKAAEIARQADDTAFRQWDKLLGMRVQEVAAIIGTANTKDRQKTMLLAVGIAVAFTAFLSGMVLPAMILRQLPASWHKPEAMAAWVMGEPGLVDAGTRLLRAGDPEGWQTVKAAVEMRNTNHDTIAACERTAAKANNPVSCTIRIRKP